MRALLVYPRFPETFWSFKKILELVKRKTRWKFWHHLFSILKNNPGVLSHYLSVCAHNEHFLAYRRKIYQLSGASLALPHLG